MAKKMKSTHSSATDNATRAEVEAKLKEIDDVITEATSSAADKAKIALGVAVAIGLAFAFIAGRRKGLRPKTIVSFTKVR